MTKAESGVRRSWVGFSALAFGLCGALLYVHFSSRPPPTAREHFGTSDPRQAPWQPGSKPGADPTLQTDGPPAGRIPATPGILKIDIPPTMIVGHPEHVRAIMGRTYQPALVDKEAGLEESQDARVPSGRQLLQSSLIRMDLRCDEPSDFEILALHPQPEQRLDYQDVTVWEWAVQPRQAGRHGLVLVVSELKESTRGRLRIKIYPVSIEVRRTTFQQLGELAVPGAGAACGLAGLLGAWLGLLRPLLRGRRARALNRT